MGAISSISHRLKGGESVTIRSATPEDAAQILNHVRCVLEDSDGVVLMPDEFTVTEEQEQEWIRDHLDDPGKVAIIAEVAGEIVGLIHLNSVPRRRLAHRATLYISIAKRWRGRGVGRVLLQTLIEWAEAHPVIEKLSLAVLANNDPAIGLYRKCGFVEEGRRVREVKLGPDQYCDDLLMYRFVKRSA
jgi:RimJ/RimL family protein N-acetyltransferase